MKRIALVILILSILISSCKKIEKLTNFYIDVNEVFTVNPSLSVDETLDVWVFMARTDDNQYFSSYGSSVEETEKIAISSFELMINSPEGQTFDFVSSIEVFMNVADMEPLKIAWLDELPGKGLTELKLSFNEDNIQDYLIEKDNIINLKIKTDSDSDIDIGIKQHYKFYITSEIDE